jgi:hypothetical protein
MTFGRLDQLPVRGCLVFCLLGAVPAAAQTLLGPARQTPAGSWRATVSYQWDADQDVNFTVPAGQATALCNGAPCSFVSASKTDVPASGSGTWTVLKLAYQPWDNVEYFVAAGGGHYALDVTSVTASNHLRGDRTGWTLGAGAKVLIVPETPVTPAVAVTAAAGREAVIFNTSRAGAASSDVDERLTLDRYQFAMSGSKRFGRAEPYGGVQWMRTVATLKALGGGGRDGGNKDSVNILVGFRWPVFEHEALVAEGQFLDGTVWRVGWEVRFK